MLVDVVLPCLDEASALPTVLRDLPDGLRPIVVDNGSTDGSAVIARELGALVLEEPRRGYGAACQRGLRHATAELVAFCDADGSIAMRDVVRLAALVAGGESDLLLGRRVAQPGSWSWHARAANRALAVPMSLAARHPLHDLGPLRVGRRADLVALGVHDARFGYPLETVLRAARSGWRVREEPVAYRPRIGRSKVTGTVRGSALAIADMSRVLVRLGRPW